MVGEDRGGENSTGTEKIKQVGRWLDKTGGYPTVRERDIVLEGEVKGKVGEGKRAHRKESTFFLRGGRKIKRELKKTIVFRTTCQMSAAVARGS